MTVKTKLQERAKRSVPGVYILSIIGEKYIPWDFSMRILIEVFYKTQEEAAAIAEDIQRDGEGICGAFIYEIAETKATIVEQEAKRAGFALQCLLEEV